MSEVELSGEPASFVSRLHDVVDDLQQLDLTRCTDDELLDAWRELERASRRLAAVEHAVIGEVEVRGTAERHACRNTAALARGLLRITPGDARRRVEGAASSGPRRALTGEALSPLFPQVAAAQADGALSPSHARIITDTITALPDQVRDDAHDEVESSLVEIARSFDPHALAKCARRVVDWYDPDGKLRDIAYRQRTRDLQLTERPDGSSRIRGDLTAECTAFLRSVLDPLSAPKPEQHGVKDPRTAGQRRHDALLDALKAALRAAQIPTAAGITTTVLLTINRRAWVTGAGWARTGHGARVPAREALRWSSGDTRLVPIALDDDGAVIGYSDARRLFTESQRLALVARDGGCSFPGCDAPPQYCEAHHIRDHARGGPTSIENGTLLCRFHHDHFQACGWRCVLRDGRPAWIPPPWLDHAQEPICNPLHDLRRPVSAERSADLIRAGDALL